MNRRIAENAKTGKWNVDQDRRRARALLWANEVQGQTLEAARNHRKRWTGPEYEVLGRDDLTAEQKAEMLGRTFFAVQNKLRRLGYGDPKTVFMAGLPKGESGGQ